jgi:hypothetical protein
MEVSRRLARRKDGVSALFDAMLFFMILLAAAGALFLSASSASRMATKDLQTRDLGRQAADIQSSALGCTLGPLPYSLNYSEHDFTGSVLDCIRTILEVRNSTADCDVDGLCAGVKDVYGLLVQKPLHYAVLAVLDATALFVSDRAASPSGIPDVRWTSAVPLILDGSEGELTLFLWR